MRILCDPAGISYLLVLLLSLLPVVPVLPVVPLVPVLELPLVESEDPGVIGAVLEAPGAVLDDDGEVEVDGEAGAGVLIGAESLEVAGAGAWSFFLQPARAASTIAVANMVLRINIDPPFVGKNVSLTSVR
ncbi:hypothetical protein D9O50_15240 [Oxalobacteraceae bacterium CAVE-383]|nr:hypothetical protein D9O50_15240 [Oxalobacteraceae bacterium CAVE-383]